MTRQVDGRYLAALHSPRGWGSSACHAENDLVRRACLLGMRPSRLGGVECHQTVAKASCPAKVSGCEPGGKPHVCTVKTGGEEEKSSALAATSWRGRSLCSAQNQVRMASCALDIDWKDLSINCVPMEIRR